MYSLGTAELLIVEILLEQTAICLSLGTNPSLQQRESLSLSNYHDLIPSWLNSLGLGTLLKVGMLHN